MKYPEYKYFDTAIGGWRNRNKVSDRLANYIGKKDTGRTYFRFAQDFLDYCEANKTVRGFSGKCYADYIPIDIDVDGDIEEALKISREFLQFVQAEFEVYIDQIPVWFSGSKGTHIALRIASDILLTLLVTGVLTSPSMKRIVFSDWRTPLIPNQDYTRLGFQIL